MRNQLCRIVFHSFAQVREQRPFSFPSLWSNSSQSIKLAYIYICVYCFLECSNARKSRLSVMAVIDLRRVRFISGEKVAVEGKKRSCNEELWRCLFFSKNLNQNLRRSTFKSNSLPRLTVHFTNSSQILKI